MGLLVTEARRAPSEAGEIEEVRLAREARDDPAAFQALYERHVHAVYRYCLSRLRDPTAAEDATSEVFLKAWSGIAGHRGGSFAAWLIVIARNTVVDSLRRRRLTADLAEAPEPIDRSPLPEDRAVAAEEHEVLLRAMTQLTDDQRAVLELQLAGWRGPEIAEALGRTPTAVKMLRHRALRRLRDLLAGDAPERPEEALDD